MEREEMKRRLQHGGDIAIDVELQVFLDSPVKYPRRSAVAVSILSQLLFASQYADASFRVGEKEFSVHKCIVAIHAPGLLDLLLLDDDDDETEE
jgi:hypothetical protein